MPSLALLARAAPRYNLATGGVITEYTVGGKRWRLHSFETAGSFDFVVLNAVKPFRLAYVGAGGGGGGQTDPYSGGGGDGGYGGDVSGISLATGTTYPIVVGTGSTGTGGTTTALGYTGNGGPGGADGNYSNGTTGTTRGPSSTIRNGVTSEQFGLGGDFWPGGYVAATPLPGHGAAGAFAGGGVTGRNGSSPGAVWIAYEIDG